MIDLAKVYIVVVKNTDNEEIYMTKAKAEKHVVDMLGNLDDNKKVERVFSVDEFGDVIHLQVVFDGRLKLVEDVNHG